MTSNNYKAVKTYNAFRLIDKTTNIAMVEIDEDGIKNIIPRNVNLSAAQTGITRTVLNSSQYDAIYQVQVPLVATSTLTGTSGNAEFLGIRLEHLEHSGYIMGAQIICSAFVGTTAGVPGNFYYSLGLAETDGLEANYAATWDAVMPRVDHAFAAPFSSNINTVTMFTAPIVVNASNQRTIYFNAWSKTSPGGWGANNTIAFGNGTAGLIVVLFVKFTI